MRTFTRALALLLPLAAAAGIAAVEAAAQETGGAGLGRPYWHVFAAYAIAWALVLGWVVSIARRLARVEKRLDD